MRGSDFFASLPERSGPEREQMILNAVRQGNYVLNWVPIEISRPPYCATIWVSNDALRIGEPGDSVRVAVTAQTEQMIADELNAVLPTAQISDEIFRQAHIKLKPVTLGSDVPMSTTSRMLTHHERVERQLRVWWDSPLTMPYEEILISPVGKDWVNSRRLIGEPHVQGAPAAINYGWHRDDVGPVAHTGPFPSATTYPPTVVYQSEGMAHPYVHQDYSQVVRLVARPMLVCVTAGSSVAGLSGEPWSCESGGKCICPGGAVGLSKCVDIYDVAQDEVLSPLVNHNGTVYMRHFAVPYEEPKGKHSIWGGVPPTIPPPPSKVTATPKGEVPPNPPAPIPVEVAAAGAGTKVISVGAGLVLGWFVAGRLVSRS